MHVSLNGHKKKPTPVAVLDDGDAIASLMAPFYEQLIQDAFDDAGDDGIDVVFDLENVYVQRVLDMLAKQVRNVAETTKDEIRQLVGQAGVEGWSNAELAKQIRAHGVTASRSRATMIARTESASGYSQGSRSAWKASGVVDRMQWLAGGPDTCDICQNLDGETVDLDGAFSSGVTAPPAHPNCTCVISPVLKD